MPKRSGTERVTRLLDGDSDDGDSGTTPMERTRAKKRAAGLVPKEVWIRPERHDELKRAEARLQRPAPASKTRRAPSGEPTGSAARARLAELRPALDRVDLSAPLPDDVTSAIALSQSNGDGHQVGPDMKRLLVLADQGLISGREAAGLMLYVDPDV